MSLRSRTLALAGVFQGASLARSAAMTGRQDSAALEASIHSVLHLESESVETVYGGVAGVRDGLAELSQQLSGDGELQRLRPVVALLSLERQLLRRDDLLERIRGGVDEARRQAEHLGTAHDTVLLQLADLYRRTVSTLRPRILVPGRPEYLGQPRLVAAVRASLLAGIRSAVLWRQVGGNRLNLLLRRQAFRRMTDELLLEAEARAGAGGGPEEGPADSRDGAPD